MERITMEHYEGDYNTDPYIHLEAGMKARRELGRPRMSE